MKTETTLEGGVTVQVRITNNGKVTGDDVPQFISRIAGETDTRRAVCSPNLDWI